MIRTTYAGPNNWKIGCGIYDVFVHWMSLCDMPKRIQPKPTRSHDWCNDLGRLQALLTLDYGKVPYLVPSMVKSVLIEQRNGLHVSRLNYLSLGLQITCYLLGKSPNFESRSNSYRLYVVPIPLLLAGPSCEPQTRAHRSPLVTKIWPHKKKTNDRHHYGANKWLKETTMNRPLQLVICTKYLREEDVFPCKKLLKSKRMMMDRALHRRPPVRFQDASWNDRASALTCWITFRANNWAHIIWAHLLCLLWKDFKPFSKKNTSWRCTIAATMSIPLKRT